MFCDITEVKIFCKQFHLRRHESNIMRNYCERYFRMLLQCLQGSGGILINNLKIENKWKFPLTGGNFHKHQSK